MNIFIKFIRITMFLVFLPVIIAAFLLLGMFGACIKQVIHGINH